MFSQHTGVGGVFGRHVGKCVEHQHTHILNRAHTETKNITNSRPEVHIEQFTEWNLEVAQVCLSVCKSR